jgi:hypothetical protein
MPNATVSLLCRWCATQASAVTLKRSRCGSRPLLADNIGHALGKPRAVVYTSVGMAQLSGL